MIHRFRRGRAGGPPGGADTGRRALSIHLRLFLGFGGALVACSALMVSVIYLGIRYVPTYDLSKTVVVPVGQVPADAVMPPASGVREGRRVDVAAPIRTKEDVWSTVLAVSVGGLLLVTAVGLGGGWLLSRRLLAPLQAVNKAAARAGEGDLSYRIDARGPRDELKELADTFDGTLARLEQSFEAHRRFAANASHELLTPLTTTRAALQMASSDPTPEELAELLPMVTAANERNIRVVEELLRLAAADQTTFDAEPVDLAALTAGCVAERRSTRPAGHEGPVPELRLADQVSEAAAPTPPALPVRGNEVLLRQLVGNLLDNAVRHNLPGPGGSVDVTVRAEDPPGSGPAVVLEVANTGPAVDPEVVDRLFEPFYRARPRVGSDRGHGLGLALVRSVARAHGGTVTARALPDGGLRVRVGLPRAAVPPGDGAPPR
ncbi:HAMP domain-containing sensor histidine kinase [Streptomyces sp. NPDC097619]|uniref:sensor histidine kinase n=1 Tax=Streptomyces sp. NPDC097619 TaxID=3157228 RepID=UPI00332D3E49